MGINGKTSDMKLDFSRMAERAQEVEDLLKRMANKNRLMILCVLYEHDELSVGKLNKQVPLSQSALSQHLSVLREAGLVATRRESQTIFYRLGDERTDTILQALHKVYCKD
jgi:DNA-binding transcriptional ArsR family regulator